MAGCRICTSFAGSRASLRTLPSAASGARSSPENFFLFGLTVEEVERIKRDGYRPADYIDGNAELAAVLDLIGNGTFSHGDTEVFRPLVENLRYDDPFLVLADYASYVECQGRVSGAWRDPAAWARMSILNTARSGKFSSDRAIAEYCDDIWNVSPVTVTRPDS
jgi:glycogen phosphorylase